MFRAKVFCLLGVLMTGYAQCVSAATVWIPAERAATLSPTMILGNKTGLQEDGALGDFLVPTITSAAERPEMDCFAEFHVDIRQAGTYCVWARLRYRWVGKASFGLVMEEKGKKGPVLPLGDSHLGGRDWHWDSQCRSDSGPGVGRLKIALQPGKLTFRITAREAPASIYQALLWRQAEPAFNPHLNLLCLTTDADYVPKDADACRALRVSPSRQTVPCQAPAVLPPLSAAEWQQLGKQPIPDWLRTARWYTKDSYRQEPAHRSPGDIAYLVRQIAACGGNVLRLSVCWGGNTYYQSHVAPHAPGLRDLDYLREAIAEGHRSGVKIVAYVSPQTLYEDHPLFQECGQWGPTGKLPATEHLFAPAATSPESTGFACMNHPRYRQFIQRRVERDFYPSINPTVCTLTACRPTTPIAFVNIAGRNIVACSAPKCPSRSWHATRIKVSIAGELESDSPLVGDPHDPDAHRLSALLAQTAAEVTGLMSRTVKGCKPDAVTIFHGYPKANTMKFYDGTLTEITGHYPAWIHAAWKFGELASYSNVFPIPVLSNMYPHERFTAAEARQKAFQSLANGIFPNFWSTPGMKPLCGFLRDHAEYYDFARTTPVKFLAMARDLRITAAQHAAPLPPGVRYADDRFQAPYVGAYSALMRSGLPVVTLHRSGFQRQLAGFRVLVLANTALLGRRQMDAVREFVRAGGGLICTHETSLYDEEGTRRPDFGLADVLGVHYRHVLPAAERSLRIATPQHPVVATVGESPLGHDEPLVAVQADSAEAIAYLDDRKSHLPEVPAILVHQFGQGRVVYLPGRWCAMQSRNLNPAIERLFAAAVRLGCAGIGPGRDPGRRDGGRDPIRSAQSPGFASGELSPRHAVSQRRSGDDRAGCRHAGSSSRPSRPANSSPVGPRRTALPTLAWPGDVQPGQTRRVRGRCGRVQVG